MGATNRTHLLMSHIAQTFCGLKVRPIGDNYYRTNGMTTRTTMIATLMQCPECRKAYNASFDA